MTMVLSTVLQYGRTAGKLQCFVKGKVTKLEIEAVMLQGK